MTEPRTDEQAFLNEIQARPDDASPLQVFADWLHDQGREEEEADQRHRACRLPAVRKALTTLAKARKADDTEQGQRILICRENMAIPPLDERKWHVFLDDFDTQPLKRRVIPTI